MGTIKVLPEHVIAKIAAGEVVERPASVVKELLDNAIDAGAKSIEINVAGGGKDSIVVIDDGSGMEASDAKRSIERHATSKISSDEDLFKIRTMGFRGEALSAISAISKMTIETKVAGTLEGTLVSVEGGALKEVRATGCPAGTKVVVDDLFYNVPARKKFLKSDGVEYGHIADCVSSMALSNSRIRFELSHGGSPKIRCHRTGDPKNRIEDVLGADVKNSIFEFAEKGDGIEINGFIVKSGLDRATAKDIHFFVNGRPVKDRILQHALLSGFETFLPRGSYPVAVLYINIDPELVDVNVHPTKREVRFAKSGMVHDFVASAVKKVVSGGDRLLSRQNGREYDVVFGLRPKNASRVSDPAASYPWMQSPPTRLPTGPAAQQTTSATVTMLISDQLRVIGQLDRAFIVCEGDEGKLVLIDQHAAHERLGFEELRGQLAKGHVEVQRLLLPERIDLSPREKAVIMEHIRGIETAGFETEDFGGGTVVIKAVPAILGDVSLKNLFEKFAVELSDFESSAAADEETDKIFQVVACHRQVRAGDSLCKEEMESLVRQMEQGGISHCPHGRPALVTIERSEVDKWFKRS